MIDQLAVQNRDVLIGEVMPQSRLQHPKRLHLAQHRGPIGVHRKRLDGTANHLGNDRIHIPLRLTRQRFKTAIDVVGQIDNDLDAHLSVILMTAEAAKAASYPASEEPEDIIGIVLEECR